jgi:hypothetical protein
LVFRSSFRDWGSEKTVHARELLEVSLAHLPEDKTEAAYWRGDVIERCLALMEDCAAYATSINNRGQHKGNSYVMSGAMTTLQPTVVAKKELSPLCTGTGILDVEAKRFAPAWYEAIGWSCSALV